LDPTVHHLFAEDRFNRGKSGRSWPGEIPANHGHYTHDAVSEAHDLWPPRCPPFLEAGTQDLLWLYKSQRKASVRRGAERTGIIIIFVPSSLKKKTEAERRRTNGGRQEREGAENTNQRK
jgi:hypothetical protein